MIKAKCHSFLTIGHVSIGVVALDQEAVAIEDSEAIDDVGAQAVVNVLRIKLASACLPAEVVSGQCIGCNTLSLPVSGPVCEVAYYLVISGEAVGKRSAKRN